MATIKADLSDPQLKKVTCDIPRCMDRRRARHQEHGRFIMSYTFEPGTITIHALCPECGGTHSMQVAIPKEAFPALTISA
jgi:hypothetical protein